jgi:hypothetical protein
MTSLQPGLLESLDTRRRILETRACTGYVPCCRLVDERNRAVSRHFCSPDAVEAYEAVRWPKSGVEGGNG